VVAGIEQKFAEQPAVLAKLVIHLERHIVGSLAAAHCAQVVIAERAAAAGALLQGIQEIWRRKTVCIKLSQRIDSTGRDYSGGKRRAMVESFSIWSGGRVGIIDTVRRAAGAGGGEIRPVSEVAFAVLGRGHRVNARLGLV